MLLGKDPFDCNLVLLHIGNGASANAVAGGISVDTSMGLTPLEGLVMGTRAGDHDPAIGHYIMNKEGLAPKEVEEMLNKKSGILGITEIFTDRRDVETAAKEGDKRAELAIEIEAYRIKKYIGAYLAALGRLDAVVFTAGIGENAPLIRVRSCAGLEPLGISIDPVKNQATIGKEADVSCDGSPIRVLVIPTDEERLIALDTYTLTQQ